MVYSDAVSEVRVRVVENVDAVSVSVFALLEV